MFRIFMEVLPLFESVTVRGGVVIVRFSWPNERLYGERVTGTAIPDPVRLTLWGLPLALSVTVSDAVRVPAADGVNVTPIMQPSCATRALPQLLVWVKSAEFVPVMPMFEMFNVAFPEFERITFWAELVEPTFCWLNVRLGVEKPTTGAGGGGGLPPPPPPPPPPQATQIPTTNNAPTNGNAAARPRLAARLVSTARHSIMANIQYLPAGARELGGTLICGAGALLLTGAVVETVTVAVTGEEPLNVNDPGVIEHDIPGAGTLKHCTLTVPVNPYSGVNESVAVAD
jgi:hypothetical protein